MMDNFIKEHLKQQKERWGFSFKKKIGMDPKIIEEQLIRLFQNYSQVSNVDGSILVPDSQGLYDILLFTALHEPDFSEIGSISPPLNYFQNRTMALNLEYWKAIDERIKLYRFYVLSTFSMTLNHLLDPSQNLVARYTYLRQLIETTLAGISTLQQINIWASTRGLKLEATKVSPKAAKVIFQSEDLRKVIFCLTIPSINSVEILYKNILGKDLPQEYQELPEDLRQMSRTCEITPRKINMMLKIFEDLDQFSIQLRYIDKIYKLCSEFVHSSPIHFELSKNQQIDKTFVNDLELGFSNCALTTIGGLANLLEKLFASKSFFSEFSAYYSEEKMLPEETYFFVELQFNDLLDFLKKDSDMKNFKKVIKEISRENLHHNE